MYTSRPSARPRTSPTRTSLRSSTSRACASAIRSRSRCPYPPVRRVPESLHLPQRRDVDYSRRLDAEGACAPPGGHWTFQVRVIHSRPAIGFRQPIAITGRTASRTSISVVVDSSFSDSTALVNALLVGRDQRAHPAPVRQGAPISRLVEHEGADAHRATPVALSTCASTQGLSRTYGSAGDEARDSTASCWCSNVFDGFGNDWQRRRPAGSSGTSLRHRNSAHPTTRNRRGHCSRPPVGTG